MFWVYLFQHGLIVFHDGRVWENGFVFFFFPIPNRGLSHTHGANQGVTMIDPTHFLAFWLRILKLVILK